MAGIRRRQGFSLAFPGDITHHSGLEEVARLQGQTPGLTLLKVTYDVDFQRQYVATLLDGLLDLCATDHLRSYPSADEAISHVTPFFWAQTEPSARLWHRSLRSRQ
jgi:hypothetical protein